VFIQKSRPRKAESVPTSVFFILVPGLCGRKDDFVISKTRQKYLNIFILIICNIELIRIKLRTGFCDLL
jgi:hypothetical protein